MTKPYDNLLATEGAQNQSFVWGNGLISGHGTDDFYYLQDHLGSPIRLLGEEKSDTLAYDEFGVPLAGAGNNINQPFGFTGYQTEDVSGLYYAQARYYAPELGRFGAEDTHWNPGNMIYGDEPYVFNNRSRLPDNHSIIQSSNLYNYCGSNPLYFIDPMGQIWQAAFAAVGAIVGGVAGAAKGVIQGMAAGDSLGTIIARGAVGAVSGAAGGAVAGVVLGSTGNIAFAGAAGGAVYGGLYGAGNAIVDGVNSGQSTKEIATSALNAGINGAVVSGAIGFGVGTVGFGMGAVIGKTFFLGASKAIVFTALNAALGFADGKYGGVINMLLEMYDNLKDYFRENAPCPA